jgi:hypothetical protein
MTRYIIRAISTASLVGLALMTASATAEAKGVRKQQLVGTWTLVSTENMKADGSKVDVFGPNPRGVLIFDRGGHYSLTIVRSDLPKFAATTSDQGTAQENKAVLAGMIASFGTYSLDEADGTLTTHVEGSSFPNLAGGEQKRIISSLTASELKYSNPATATGSKAEVVWQRTK